LGSPELLVQTRFFYSFLMKTASLFADPNLLQLESEAMINTDAASSQRSADATAPFAPKARESPNQVAKLTIGDLGYRGKKFQDMLIEEVDMLMLTRADATDRKKLLSH
jgi:hypothetical protein